MLVLLFLSMMLMLLSLLLLLLFLPSVLPILLLLFLLLGLVTRVTLLCHAVLCSSPFEGNVRLHSVLRLLFSVCDSDSSWWGVKVGM